MGGIIGGIQVQGDHPVTAISYWLWKERFQSDPNIVGKKLLLRTELCANKQHPLSE
jgi:hypothetical protein